MSLQDEITKLEKEIPQIEKEKNDTAAFYDQKITTEREQPRPRLEIISSLEAKKNGISAAHERMLSERRATLETKRAALAEYQRGEEKKQAEAAAVEERREKRMARQRYTGTDAEFEQAWPEIWNDIRNRRAAAEVERPRRPIVHL